MTGFGVGAGVGLRDGIEDGARIGDGPGDGIGSSVDETIGVARALWVAISATIAVDGGVGTAHEISPQMAKSTNPVNRVMRTLLFTSFIVN